MNFKNQPEQFWPFPMYPGLQLQLKDPSVLSGGIFTTIVRVVQAFVCVSVIIKVNIKFILNRQEVSRVTSII